MADSIYKTYRPSGGTEGLFLKLGDGDSVKLRIASECAIFESDFDGNISTRFAWVVWNRGDEKAQVFNGGASIYGQIADLVDDWGEPTSFDITVKRKGTGLETRYSVTPAPKSTDLTKEQQEACEEVDLLKAVKGRWLSEFVDNPHPEEESQELDKDMLNDIFPE